jgi:hypothetical protein
MRLVLAYLCRCLSSLFFELNVLLFKDNRATVDFAVLKKFQKCTDGIFFGCDLIDGRAYGLFANKRIGFFYKDKLFRDDVINFPYPELATEEELGEVKQYLIDKIFECHSLMKKLEHEI